MNLIMIVLYGGLAGTGLASGTSRTPRATGSGRNGMLVEHQGSATVAYHRSGAFHGRVSPLARPAEVAVSKRQMFK